jgi:hypothetical protein
LGITAWRDASIGEGFEKDFMTEFRSPEVSITTTAMTIPEKPYKSVQLVGKTGGKFRIQLTEPLDTGGIAIDRYYVRLRKRRTCREPTSGVCPDGFPNLFEESDGNFCNNSIGEITCPNDCSSAPKTPAVYGHMTRVGKDSNAENHGEAQCYLDSQTERLAPTKVNNALNRELAVQCCSIDSTDGKPATRFKDSSCMQAVTYEQALKRCDDEGQRLCTDAEVQADIGAGKGCDHDARHVWTSTTCVYSNASAAEYCHQDNSVNPCRTPSGCPAAADTDDDNTWRIAHFDKTTDCHTWNNARMMMEDSFGFGCTVLDIAAYDDTVDVTEIQKKDSTKLKECALPPYERTYLEYNTEYEFQYVAVNPVTECIELPLTATMMSSSDTDMMLSGEQYLITGGISKPDPPRCVREWNYNEPCPNRYDQAFSTDAILGFVWASLPPIDEDADEKVASEKRNSFLDVWNNLPQEETRISDYHTKMKTKYQLHQFLVLNQPQLNPFYLLLLALVLKPLQLIQQQRNRFDLFRRNKQEFVVPTITDEKYTNR